MKKASWSNAFPLVYRKIRERFSEEILSESSLVFEACKVKLLKSDDYLAWASNYYGVAIIKHSYFEQMFDSKYYYNYQEVFDWSEECFPLFEWENILFVACLDPHMVMNIPYDLNIKPILAGYEELIYGWDKIKSAKLEVQNFEKLESKKNSDSEDSGEQENDFKKNDPFLYPDGLLLEDEPTPLNSPPLPKIPPPVVINDDTFENDSPPLKLRLPDESSEFELINESEIKKPTLSFNLLDGILKNIYLQSNKYFDRSMFLECIGDDYCIPVHCDSNFEKSEKSELSEKDKFINMRVPSPFRISFSTKKPFHGKIHDNKVTNQFFKIWLNDLKNYESLYLTLIPVLNDQIVIGLLLFLRSNKENSKASLEFAITLGESLGDELKKLTFLNNSA